MSAKHLGYMYIDPNTHQACISEERPPVVFCDFCCTPEVYKLYPTEDHELPEQVPGLTQVATGGWTACRTCAELVEAEKWDELAERSTDQFMQKEKVPAPYRAKIRREIARTHQAFRSARRKPEC